ncbi:MAG: nucleotidyl transferase AbiEii/AbiGii toxin family protein [Candidatus Woesearchaeota archaeon]|jgi:predicted nucleotidyltransferase component of viral defense system|nr:nucleotidyl transferase AbiEii/AbiGii toxin family protein [Candidatus Woesearchaeota archaeon]
MVYLRKVIVHGHIYIHLVKCERDENGEPRQTFLKYIKESDIDIELLKNINKYLDELSTMEILRFKKAVYKKINKNIDSEIHNFEELINYLYTKTKIQKDVIKNILELYIKEDVLFKLELEGGASNQLNEQEALEIYTYHRKEGFGQTQVEKVYRLTKVLEQLSKKPLIRDKLIFYGGTALNFINKKVIPRLSVDLDFTYNSSEKPNKKEIIDCVNRTLKELKYTDIEKSENKERNTTNIKIKYINIEANTDSIEVDLNFKIKTSFYPTKNSSFSHPFSTINKFKVNSYCTEELYGAKFNAVLTRTHPRDLYDIANMPKNIKLDKVKAAFIHDSTNKGTDIRNFDLKIVEEKFNERVVTNQFERHLRTMLRSGEDLDAQKLYKTTLDLTKDMLNLNKKEIEYAKRNLK